MTCTALVTGIEGFTGPYMAAELERLVYAVHGLTRTGRQSQTRTVVDLLDGDGLTEVVQRIRPEVVVHLAGISHVAHRDVSAIYQANIVGTRNLLEALSSLSKVPSGVLIASSAHVYGSSSHETLDEGSAMRPFNDYAISKVATEYLAQLYGDRLPVVVTRPFNYTGIGQSNAFFVPKIVDHARRGAHQLRLGNLDVERDFTDVRDLVRSYGLLINRGLEGEVVNVCSGVSTSLRTIIDIVSELSGVDFAIESDADLVRTNEVNRLVGSNLHLQSLTGGIEFRSLRETIKWMLQA